MSEELLFYSNRETDLSTENGCLLWGIRVIVPKSLQSRVLQSLHANHPGVSRMKTIARSHFWWKGLDKDIETRGRHVIPAKPISPILQLRHYIYGVGQIYHGDAFTSILQAHFLDTCSS